MAINKIIVISGPTASGKTSYAVDYAEKNNGVIINADSMQIYSGLPILSAQPSREEFNRVEHLLFSFLTPEDNCNVGRWLEFAKDRIEYCFDNGKTPVIVGGTGMYISKLINGISKIPEIPLDFRNNITAMYNEIGHDEFYKKALSIDSKYVEQLNKNDRQRLIRVVEVYLYTGRTLKFFQNEGNITIYPREKFFHINLNPPRDILYKRCSDRFKKMVYKDSVINEVEKFIRDNMAIIENFKNYSITNTIGLMEIKKYLAGEISIEEAIEISTRLTKNYAKRQCTWFNHQFDHFDLRVCDI